MNIEKIRQGARLELARRNFYEYCKLKYPKSYTEDKRYLVDVCSTLQHFLGESKKHFLVLNLPPRHYKSFTGKNLTEWEFGRNNKLKIMTGSYNEILSSTFARQVRNTIEEKKTSDNQLVYSDIFSETKVKYGEASASLWALEGSNEKSYLATSPGGTATGFGTNIIIIDDVIKNKEEAYNELVLNKHWEWFTNTMMQRTEGTDWKVIVIMTRWATNDLAGRIIEAYGDDVEIITFKAVQEDGSMLCESILTKQDYELKIKEMLPDIAEANYNQEAIDIKGRLYEGFKTYEKLPEKQGMKQNYTDTADTGLDFLCSVDFIENNGDVYITDVVMTDEAMEVTEPKVARMLDSDGVERAVIESNNGGRGFARNIQRILSSELNNFKCIVKWVNQHSNKEARILSSSAWVQEHVYMPHNWKEKWPEFYKQLTKYQRKGKNEHDDAPDVLAGIYELCTNKKTVKAYAEKPAGW